MALFTPDNARDMSERGKVALARIRENRRDLAGKVAALAEKIAELSERPVDNVDARLVRVRKQLDMLNTAMDNALAGGMPNPMTVRGLADSIARLSEVERILAGKPLPGSLKPSTRSPRSSTTTQREPEPADSTPPVVVPPAELDPPTV
jgi:hypothetical protein